MTLDDAEKLAREQLSGEASADSHVRQLLRADKLARLIVNVLPVVRAAERREGARRECQRTGRGHDALVLASEALEDAIDTMRAALEKS